MHNPRATVGRLIVGGFLLCFAVALTVGALLLPVRTSQLQPPPSGQEWVGVPPSVEVDCGTLLQPHDPVWPEEIRDRVSTLANAVALRGCGTERGSRRIMTATFGVLDTFIVAVMVIGLRKRRRTLDGVASVRVR